MDKNKLLNKIALHQKNSKELDIEIFEAFQELIEIRKRNEISLRVFSKSLGLSWTRVFQIEAKDFISISHYLKYYEAVEKCLEDLKNGST